MEILPFGSLPDSNKTDTAPSLQNAEKELFAS